MSATLNAMSKRQEKAFDFAADLAKQLITLSTGIITITTAFQKDIFAQGFTKVSIVMIVGWMLLLLSAGAGVTTLMALTGALVDRDVADISLTPTVRDVSKSARAQIICFIAGLFCAIVYSTVAGLLSIK